MPDYFLLEKTLIGQCKIVETQKFLKNNNIYLRLRGEKLPGSGRKLENQEFLQNQEKWHL